MQLREKIAHVSQDSQKGRLRNMFVSILHSVLPFSACAASPGIGKHPVEKKQQLFTEIPSFMMQLKKSWMTDICLCTVTLAVPSGWDTRV